MTAILPRGRRRGGPGARR